ncbi:MAG: gamma-glutamyltransferase [Candidatus Sericytochromatia bacterium]|nr:gamma-glutamyltransferase [Candidatus Sericytochromatia bacterium]
MKGRLRAGVCLVLLAAGAVVPGWPAQATDLMGGPPAASGATHVAPTAPEAPTVLPPAAAPRSLPTVRPSAYPTPGYRPRPIAVSRMPYEASWLYRQPQPAVLARRGAVACVSAIASQVGVEVLKRGGNAVDAAIAVGFALAVVYPEAGNLGGGGFMLVHAPGGGQSALDYRETAPAAARPDMFLDRLGNATSASQVGVRAVGVPGTVAGFEAAHRRYGKRPWADLVAPAIRLARDGFIVNEYLSGSFYRAQDLLMRFPESRRVFLPEGLTPKAGERFRQPDLAVTLQRIARQGARGFYSGPTAQAIAQDIARQGGVLSVADMQAYRPRWREPLRFDYRGQTIVTMPLPSSGGVTMAQILNILEGVDLPKLGWHSARHLHWLTEAERRAFADRNAFLADPDFLPDQPVKRLISKAYALRRRASIREDASTPAFGRQPGPVESEQTTHYCVVDAGGMAVSNTYTLNGNFGCGVVARGTGVLLNNEMDDFTVKPGGVNQFGLRQGPLNQVAPGKRPLSSMTPTIVLDAQGRPQFVLGSPGGPTIITTVTQVLSNVLDFKLPLNWAIAAPRLHHQAQPDLLYQEPGGLDALTRVELVRLGHQVQARPLIGDAQGILRRPDGAWEAYADPRRGGEAFGY